jgi:hypothetical protein
MYRHCIFCSKDLGSNEVVEVFPVGRRLAFDAHRGRLWVVCPSCERWNLTPMEERWEALETCEREFREARLRVSSENIGLARLREGLQLVRIGDPLRPEMAAWRYGDQFGRRRKKALILGSAGALVGGGFIVGSASIGLFGLIGLPFQLVQLAQQALIRPVALPGPGGGTVTVDSQSLGAAKLRPRDDGWQLEVFHKEGSEILTGREAVEALGIILPRVNRSGGRKSVVRDAVRELEEAGSAEAYFHQAEFRARKRGWGHGPVAGLPASIRLALEMGAHEEQERAAAEGELARLEARWRDAEEIAAIADDLALPDWVRASLARIKRQQGIEG